MAMQVCIRAYSQWVNFLIGELRISYFSFIFSGFSPKLIKSLFKFWKIVHLKEIWHQRWNNTAQTSILSNSIKLIIWKETRKWRNVGRSIWQWNETMLWSETFFLSWNLLFIQNVSNLLTHPRMLISDRNYWILLYS